MDQRGISYGVSYQPDWLRQIRISRKLPSGRQSTMTLFRNPAERSQRPPGDRVRTCIVCPEQDLNVEVVISGDTAHLPQVTVSCEVPAAAGNGTEELTFVLQSGLASG